MPGKRKTEKDYHKLAKEVGVRWTGPYPHTTHVKTVWECERGHRFEAAYRNIKRSPGCPTCGKDPRRVLPAEYDALAKRRGFEWLGPKAPNTITKTWWRCSEGHKWEAIYGSLQAGSGCPVCAGHIRKEPADYHVLAQENDFKWLGPEVPNNRTKTLWECGQGHQWESTYGDIQQGKGCPYCSGVALKTVEDYLSLAEERGFKWLGPFPKSITTKTKWKCLEGHEWAATFANIYHHGSGCPHCAGQFPKNEEDYHKLAESIGYEWLGPFPKAVRYKTNWRCPEGHIWTVSYNSIQQGRRCRHCAGQTPKTSSDYHKLARERGFEWVGEFPKTTDFKTLWQCPEGHEWLATYDKVRQGRGCPYCSNSVPKTEGDYRDVAKDRGFEWLGPLPKGVIIPTRWECQEGHQWMASYNNVSRGTGCPECIDLVNGVRVSQPQVAICEMLGGELNYPVGTYRVDIALSDQRIAIEYDSWYWHGGRLEGDKIRDDELLSAGWKILHVRSNNAIPAKQQLDNAIMSLSDEKQVAIITLDDWGGGPVFTD